MRYVVGWVLASILMGYLGRKRYVGFWGFFLFSMVFSPIVGALSLIFSKPPKPKVEIRYVPVDSGQSADGDAAAPAGTIPATGLAGRLARLPSYYLFVFWGLSVLVFAGVYQLQYQFQGVGQTFISTLMMSLDAATLGEPESLRNLNALLVGLQRFTVLIFLALLIARLVTSRQDRLMGEVHEVAEVTQTELKKIGEMMTEYEERLEERVDQVLTRADERQSQGSRASGSDDRPVGVGAGEGNQV